MKLIAFCIAGMIVATPCDSQSHTAAANSGTRDLVRFTNASSGPGIEPGEYQYDSHTIAMSVPGMPSDYGAKQIQEERSGQIITRVRHCVSREEALDARLIFSAGDKTCQFPRFAMTGGKIDVQLVCPNGAQTETRTLTGNYTPTSISVDMLSRVTGGPRSGATMKMHFDAKRIGPCSEADG